jgi:hypothetical protein
MEIDFNLIAQARVQTLLARNVKISHALLRSEALDMHTDWDNAHPGKNIKFSSVMDAFLKAAKVEGVRLF